MRTNRRIAAKLGIAGMVMAAVAMAAFGLGAVTGIPDSAGVFHACFDNTSGAVRLVENPGKCKVNEQATNWNQAGVDITPQVPIILLANGTIVRGTGFTATNPSPGLYRLEFPPGAFVPPSHLDDFSSIPIAHVTPRGSGDTVANVSAVIVEEDGSGLIVIAVKNLAGDPIGSNLFITITK